jgi:hypothetical protein
MDTSKSRLKDLVSMLLEPITPVWPSTEKCLECKDERRRIQVDPDARPEQLPIVGALGMVHHELATLVADEQLEGDPALRGRGNGSVPELIGAPWRLSCRCQCR